MTAPFEIYAYSIQKLKELLANKSESNSSAISKKLHSDYFEGYFDYIGAKTILVENEYIDKDFLEDFAGYYVRCFPEYSRKCTRLHFFGASFTEQEFDGFLRGADCTLTVDSLDGSYLGFVVVKPLPETVVGRSCLKTYPKEGRRFFPITRTYDVNLFGLILKVRETLAFQEQDSVVAACATSALWSVFQGTGKLFQHPIPSPVEITRAATEHLPTENRSFPNKGLTSFMMAHAVRSVNLEPFLVKVADHYVLKSTLYAYLRGGLPTVLGIDLFDTCTCPSRGMGKHAVAVTGYSLGHDKPKPHPSGFLLRASRIDKIYVHDDQVGPFARMVFDEKQIAIQYGGGVSQGVSLHTSWRGGDGKIGSARALSDILLVPLYHKIRIPFNIVHDVVLGFDLFLSMLASSTKVPYVAGFEWDIHLTTVNDLKSEVLAYNDRAARDTYFRDVLLEPMPRFLWRAKAYSGSSRLVDLLFDATDIEQGSFFLRAIECDESFSQFLAVVAREPAVEAMYISRPEWQILKWFKQR